MLIVKSSAVQGINSCVYTYTYVFTGKLCGSGIGDVLCITAGRSGWLVAGGTGW